LREKEHATEREAEFKRLANAFGLELKETEEDTTAEVQKGNERLDVRLQKMDALAQAALQVGEHMEGVRLQGLSGDIAFASRVLDEGVGQSLNMVNTAIARLNDELNKAGTPEQRERIRALIADLKELRDVMGGTGDEAVLTKERVGEIASDAMTTAFMNLGQAIGEGESLIRSMGAAAQSVLSQVAQQIAKILIAQGAALVASAVIPGQQGNAAKGAALIAAGAALSATASAIGGIGGGGGAPTGRSRRDFEGGGVAGFGSASRSASQRRGSGQQGTGVQVGVNVGLDDATFKTDYGQLRARLQEQDRIVKRVGTQ
jgi:hypothetical protein